MSNGSSGRRQALAGMLALALAGCTVIRTQGQGPTTGSGDNSSFSEAGVEHIETERRAVVDLSTALTADALVTRVEEVAGQVGLDRARVDSFATAARDGRADTWLNGGDHLGFTVGLHPVLRPGEAPVLEHQLTPPD